MYSCQFGQDTVIRTPKNNNNNNSFLRDPQFNKLAFM